MYTPAINYFFLTFESEKLRKRKNVSLRKIDVILNTLHKFNILSCLFKNMYLDEASS